jgi:SAM-dependent methyltransferase
MTKPTRELQAQLSQFWSTRAQARAPGTLEVRTRQEQQVWLDALRALLPHVSADVLDVGTGQGFVALLLAALGHRVIGIDTAEGMLAAARAHAASSPNPPDFRLGDATHPPLAPASVDVVVNRQVVWTLIDPATAVRHWLALLRPGGQLLSIHLRQSVFTADSAYPEEVKAVLPALRLGPSDQAVVTRFDRDYPDAVANLARETGFVNVKLTDLEEVNRFEEEIGTQRRWLALTGTRPS